MLVPLGHRPTYPSSHGSGYEYHHSKLDIAAADSDREGRRRQFTRRSFPPSALVPVARRLGCEVFVVDAGWYRTDEAESAESWEARTGDWRTSHQRFPNGLREVAEACHAQGMRFRLQFEPVIGPLSALRREHPEWLHHIDGKPPAPDARGMLNLGIPAARRHVFERVTRILSTVAVTRLSG